MTMTNWETEVKKLYPNAVFRRAYSGLLEAWENDLYQVVVGFWDGADRSRIRAKV